MSVDVIRAALGLPDELLVCLVELDLVRIVDVLLDFHRLGTSLDQSYNRGYRVSGPEFGAGEERASSGLMVGSVHGEEVGVALESQYQCQA